MHHSIPEYAVLRQKVNSFVGMAQPLLRWNPCQILHLKYQKFRRVNPCHTHPTTFAPLLKRIAVSPKYFPQVFTHGKRPMGRFEADVVAIPLSESADLHISDEIWFCSQMKKTSLASFRPHHPGQFCSKPLTMLPTTGHTKWKSYTGSDCHCCFDDRCIQ